MTDKTSTAVIPPMPREAKPTKKQLLNIFQVIDETPIQPGGINGARSQHLLFVNQKQEQFKIDIRSESIVEQSYAKLSKWTPQSGWQVIICKNPKRDFQIDLSHQDLKSYYPETFEPIIHRLMELALRF